jgi:hypothetical protein
MSSRTSALSKFFKVLSPYKIYGLEENSGSGDDCEKDDVTNVTRMVIIKISFFMSFKF